MTVSCTSDKNRTSRENVRRTGLFFYFYIISTRTGRFGNIIGRKKTKKQKKPRPKEFFSFPIFFIINPGERLAYVLDAYKLSVSPRRFFIEKLKSPYAVTHIRP